MEGKQKSRPCVLGITGGVGAGKSTVLACLQERHGAHLIEADLVARQAQAPGGICYEPMRRLFGAEYLLPDGSFDRAKLAAAVFADRQLLERLNGIVHPAVRDAVISRIAEIKRTACAPLIVIEAAVFFEEHYDELCDAVWYVYADEQTRALRLMQDRGYSAERVRRMMANQMTEEEFRSRCDAVIDNCKGRGDLAAQIARQLQGR